MAQETTMEAKVNGLKGPSSTSAAQMVDDLADGQQAPQHSTVSRSHLRELLNRVLHAHEDDSLTADAGEEVLHINHKLIHVVVRACIAHDASADPFEEKGSRQAMQVDCLQVIALTIAKTPEVLYMPMTIGPSSSVLQMPLFPWLLTHVLRLLAASNEQLEAAAGEVLEACTSTRPRRPGRWPTLDPIMAFLKGCVDDLLSSLSTLSWDRAGATIICGPSHETLTECIGFEPERSDANPGLVFQSISDCVRSLCALIEAILVCNKMKSALQGSGHTSGNIGWVFGCLHDLWALTKPHLHSEVKPIVLRSILSATRQALSRLENIHMGTQLRLTCAQTFTDTIASALGLVVRCSTANFDASVEKELHSSMIAAIKLSSIDKSVSALFEELVAPAAQEMLQADTGGQIVTGNLHQILQMATCRDVQKRSAEEDLTSSAEVQTGAFSQPTTAPDNGAASSEQPPAKRRRLNSHQARKAADDEGVIMEGLEAFLDPASPDRLSRFQDALSKIEAADEATQTTATLHLGRLACLKSLHDLQRDCPACDSTTSKVNPRSLPGALDCTELAEALLRIVKVFQEQRRDRPRVAAMISLRRLLSHDARQSERTRWSSTLGQWTMQALKSSVRDLRISACFTAAAWIADRPDQHAPDEVRTQILDVLRTTADGEDTSSQETCILGLGEAARASFGEVETNIILLRLIEFLGHPNALLQHLAYEELHDLGRKSASGMLRLLGPYWQTIAISIVKDLHTRPQICQQVSDLLGCGVPEFLRMTQCYTIPYLILTGRRDILQRIADANSGESDLVTICLQREQLAAILAHLLLQPAQDPEAFVLSRLNDISPAFASSDVFKTDPMQIGFELLKVAGDHDPRTVARVRQALVYLADKIQRRIPGRKSSAKQSESVGSFFEEGALGIMQSFSDIVSQTKGPVANGDRRRCIGAIREMIKMAQEHLSNAIPQITSCLQLAIQTPALCDEGLQAWLALLTTQAADDVKDLINPTFALLVSCWKTLSPATQQIAHDAIATLVKNRSELIHDIIDTLPSLGPISLFDKLDRELKKLQAQMDSKRQLRAFTQRCRSENSAVVASAVSELSVYLGCHQDEWHSLATSETLDPLVPDLVRSLLTAAAAAGTANDDHIQSLARCLGLLGCLDPNKVEISEERHEVFVLSNFISATETIEWVIFFIEHVLVNAFRSTTDTRSQGLLAYALQELLRCCGFEVANTLRRDPEPDDMYKRWIEMREGVRSILTPFITSRYVLDAPSVAPACPYPIYNDDMTHAVWLRQITSDLMQKCMGKNVSAVFSICLRIIRRQSLAIPRFLLPYAVLNLLLDGTGTQQEEIMKEFLHVLARPLSSEASPARQNLLLCSNDAFVSLDHCVRWLQEKKKETSQGRARPLETTRVTVQLANIQGLEQRLQSVPAAIMSKRAEECGLYARSLYYWEKHIRQVNDSDGADTDQLYKRLQDIYSRIDEPDGIEGISAQLKFHNLDQDILAHQRAGDWTVVQSWHEIELQHNTHDDKAQAKLMSCLQQSGQYAALLNMTRCCSDKLSSTRTLAAFAVEASWNTNNWSAMKEALARTDRSAANDPSVGFGVALSAISNRDHQDFHATISRMRRESIRTIADRRLSSLETSHATMLILQALAELEMIEDHQGAGDHASQDQTFARLDRRLELLGSFTSDKQYLLGLRRAATQLSSKKYSTKHVSSLWLSSAQLARKGNRNHEAYNAVLHAMKSGDGRALIEHARLLWKQGRHRKAINNLESAIKGDAFGDEVNTWRRSSVRVAGQRGQEQNPIAARAHLLLAKWTDQAGQTQSDLIIKQYRTAVDLENRSDKGHFYLGKYYNKLLESERAKPKAKQASTYVSGETTKLVIENYLRSLAYGSRYIYQTLPQILRLWLELGQATLERLSENVGPDRAARQQLEHQRKKIFDTVMAQMRKYIDRLPAYVFYTCFAQIVARITEKNPVVFASLVDIVVKIVLAHPQQALWTLLALVQSPESTERHLRGKKCCEKIEQNAQELTSHNGRSEIRSLMTQGRRLTAQLINVCNGYLGDKKGHISLSHDLGFVHSRSTPCRLVIPIEAALTATLPTSTDSIRAHRAFSKDTVTISAFLDDALLLQSLIRPRRVSIRGSDGRVYAMLCKPKDDLRKDQRLLEFNSMIGRMIKKDAACSQRRLYIRTYAVTPLNEECGLIEWMGGLRTLRDILSDLYRQKNVNIDYAQLKNDLTAVSRDKSQVHVFTDQILKQFRPVFHEWFTDQFPEPETWFAARLRYTRSCAVMSMVGHVLGLGDRHGENILFEEGRGGTAHVDFNCLFDKGQTFEFPERVPFRLTHNMVDAMGVYGCEGPFRRACELTLALLRQHEHTLMTSLTPFVTDPTTDHVGKRGKPPSWGDPEAVLEKVRNKVRGLLPGESVPLSVEGYVQVQIHEARDPWNLARMYLGWCAFF